MTIGIVYTDVHYALHGDNQMKKNQLKEKQIQVSNSKAVSRGRLEHFFNNPGLTSFAALQKCLFVYADQFGELVEISQKPEDLKVE